MINKRSILELPWSGWIYYVTGYITLWHYNIIFYIRDLKNNYLNI